MIRNINPKGLAWPDCWFQPGFKEHIPRDEGLKLFNETLEGVLRRFEARLKQDVAEKEHVRGAERGEEKHRP